MFGFPRAVPTAHVLRSRVCRGLQGSATAKVKIISSLTGKAGGPGREASGKASTF